MLKDETRTDLLLASGEVPYAPCRKCSRCTSGTGRDRDPNATDCWDDHLTHAALHAQSPA